MTKDLNYIPLNNELLLFLRIVLEYLINIQGEQNKVLILSEEILQYLSDINNLNEMSIQIHDDILANNLLNDINNFKKFSKEKLSFPNNSLDEVITYIQNKKLLLIKTLKNAMKEIYNKSQKNTNEQLKKSCCDFVKNINDEVLKIEKSKIRQN